MLKFENEKWLLLLAILPMALLLWRIFQNWRKQTIQKLGAPVAIESMLRHFSPKDWNTRLVILASAFVLIVLAVANPQGDGIRQKVKQKSADIYIALDISQSMLAADLPPNRLERAKLFAQKLVQALPAQRIGLIFFAGGAYLQMPLTTDAAAAISLLKSANTDWVSEQGTAIGAVFSLAEKNFDPKIPAGKAIVIITDGENHDDEAISAAKNAKKMGITAFVVGVGSPEGAPIPVGMTGYKRDEKGEIVQTRLHPQLIRDLAKAGDGAAFFLENEDKTVAALKEQLNRLEKREVEARSIREFETYFQWLLLPAILLLLLEMMGGVLLKKSKKLLVFLPIILFWSKTIGVQAQSAHDYRVKGDRAFNKKEMSQAEENYRRALEKSPNQPQTLYNLGNSLYYQGRYPQAAEYFERAAPHADTPDRRADAYFNAGNAYFKDNKFEKAVDAYKNSLKNRPNDVETMQSLELARRRLELQKQQKQQQQQNQQQEKQQQQQNQQQEKQQQQQNQQQEKQQQQQNKNQPEQQPNNNQNQPSNPHQKPPQQPENQEDKQQKLDQEQARRLLETTIEREDQKNGKKYRQQVKSQRKSEKDW